MTHLQETIEVPRPIAEAFRYTSDFGNIEQWDPGVIESEKLSSPASGYRVPSSGQVWVINDTNALCDHSL